MASYDFACKSCENEYEVYVPGFIKEQDKVCPKCGSVDVRQKFASFLRNLGADPSSGCTPRRGSGFG
jgi:putative FmdB family regulatory protein